LTPPRPRHLRPVEQSPAEAPSPAEITAELVARARSGDMAAWSRLYQDNFLRIYGHLRHLTGDPQVAEELVQETFVQALPRIHTFDGRSAFTTWLHGVAINIARNYWRSRRSTAKAHSAFEAVQAARPAAQEAPDHRIHRQRRIAGLYAALELLPDHLRIAFVLRDLEGLSPEDAAERLGITPGNLAVRACRARERLRSELSRRGLLHEEPGV
jgi:RNA polymerase sigma-70 factor (ECF subfamily)